VIQQTIFEINLGIFRPVHEMYEFGKIRNTFEKASTNRADLTTVQTKSIFHIFIIIAD
jgi:hypothetical protein